MGGTMEYYLGTEDYGTVDNISLLWSNLNISTFGSSPGNSSQNDTTNGSPTEGWFTEVASTESEHEQSSSSPAWLATTLATMWSTTTTSATTTTLWTRPTIPPSPQANIPATPQGPDLSPLGFLAIIIVTVLSNSVMCLAIRLDKRLHHMTYYFFQSMGCMHLLMAGLIMPPAILVSLQGQ